MYFKQIELQGFKSFADRTRLSLDTGVTAIVGPNGCGKSNILDALRWALGEQSARALRGSHMQDVIFNGSEDRPPTGMAEVTLTFDNADSRLPVDFAEVQVSRRVYRSGESEYLMNQAPCRLKDVQELFMDTGIGTNAYSLIGQGKIDLVLSSKPEDRRFLFEEAAGIIKYKSRKRTAMRKLDAAQQNLLRLNDIIAEVQRQMRSLKRQVNAAIRHREFTAALRELEVRNAWLQYNELVGRIADLKALFTAARDHYEAASAETSRFEAQAEELGLKRVELERTLMARRDGERQVDSEMERLESQNALLRQESDFARQQREQALREEREFKGRAEGIVEALRQTGEETASLQAEISATQETSAATQAEYAAEQAEVAQADAAVEEMRGRALETLHSRNRAHTELETLGVNLGHIDEQLEHIYERQKARGIRHEEVATQLCALQQREGEKQRSLTEAIEQREASQEKRAGLSGRLQTLNEQWQNLREEGSRQEARLTSLRELRDSYEGFTAGVRAIMQAKQRDVPEAKGILGPVGDLLAAEKDYERAIEAALGGNINNVVVEEAEAAKSAIAFLKEHQAGRVTFLPLDTIRTASRDDREALRGMPGVIGSAIDHVHYDAPIRPAVEYLLYNTVIVQTIDDAIRIARSERRFPRLVTLDGEVVSSSGAVTGGRTKHEGRGLLGRSAEIEELDRQVAHVAGQVRGIAHEAQAVTDALEEVTQTIKSLGDTESTYRAELNDLGVTLARYTTELENLTQSDRQLTQERDTLLTQREALETRRASAQEKASTMESEGEALQRQIAEAQEAASKKREALSRCSDKLADLRVRLVGLTRSLEEAERTVSRQQRELDEAQHEAARRREQAQDLNARESELENETANNIERQKALSESRDEAHRKVLEAQQEQQALLEAAETISRAIKEARAKASEAQKEVHSLELELSHKEDQAAFFQERMIKEYTLALDQLTEEEVGTDEYDENEREVLIQEYRQKLERLGAVNLMAIEEFETLEARNNFLVSQEEDLRKSREALLDIVERIDGTILEMFMETFRRIQENFRDYFRRLFNGGQARIYLLDEDEPLESGIEIEARPPGKKPQTISLLSGGEQALTAIALLFSIFSAKPSPFCVLDEVDAALDDANIERFLAMLREFAAESQFIIITHNKQTMSQSDALFGITQQERGVSQLVSVRFEEVADSETAA